MSRGRPAPLTRLLAGLRAAALCAVLLALAFPSLPLPTRARRLVILLDVSESIGASLAEGARREALEALSSLGRRDRAAVVAFAGGTRTICGLGSPDAAMRALEAAELSAPRPGSTDLGAAIALSLALAGKGRGAILLAYCDGRSNSGDPLPAALLARSGVPLLASPRGRPGLAGSGLGLELPEAAEPGERIAAAWLLGSAADDEVEYEVRSDGALAAKGKARLVAGRNRIAFELDAGGEGTRLLEARLLGGGGAAASGILVVGSGSSVLVVSPEGRSPIALALRAQGLAALERGPEGLPTVPAGYAGSSCLVLDDLPALAMSEAQQAAMIGYVSGGGGLLVVGGERSLGRGEYYATPLAELLPVETDSRRRLFFTRAKLLFIIDHSGSMAERIGSGSKQLAAMRGIAAALEGLGPQDEVAILGFDSSPSWALRFTPASRREAILEALGALDEGGGTDLPGALDEALRGFGPPGPEKRRAILLTDGLAFEADYRELARRFRSAGVSVTAVGIGAEVNEELLRDIAAWTEGSYYRAAIDQLPRIVDEEAALLTRELVQEGRIATRIATPSPMTRGLGDPPPRMGGYLLTKAKPLASVLLDTPTKEGADPILSVWRYGAGRVAVFASDSGRRWLAPWSGLPAYNLLWAQAVRALGRPGPDDGLRARAEVEGGAARIVVEARDPLGRSASGLRLRGASLDGRQAFELAETASGRYEALVPLAGPGLAGFLLSEASLGSRALAWAWVPPGAELAATGPDQAALALLASASGGAVLGQGELASLPRAWSWERAALRLPLVLAALALFLAELCLRSLSFGQLAAASVAITRWAQEQSRAAEALRGPGSRRRGGEDAPGR